MKRWSLEDENLAGATDPDFLDPSCQVVNLKFSTWFQTVRREAWPFSHGKIPIFFRFFPILTGFNDWHLSSARATRKMAAHKSIWRATSETQTGPDKPCLKIMQIHPEKSSPNC